MDAQKSVGRRVTVDRLAEELRAPARKFFGVQLSESGLVRRNSKSRISFNRRYRKFAWVFGSTAIVISLLSNLEARDKELHQVALKKMDARDAESMRAVSAKKRVA